MVPSSMSAVKQVTGSFILPNSDPEIETISTYLSDDYDNAENNFVMGDDPVMRIFVKILVNDLNGYEEAQSVRFKVVKMEDNNEEDFRFREYMGAEFKEGSGTSASYTSYFDMINNDEDGDYRIKVQVSDGFGVVTTHKDFRFTKESINDTAVTPTGFVVIDALNFRENSFFRLISSFFANVFG